MILHQFVWLLIHIDDVLMAGVQSVHGESVVAERQTGDEGGHEDRGAEGAQHGCMSTVRDTASTSSLWECQQPEKVVTSTALVIPDTG